MRFLDNSCNLDLKKQKNCGWRNSCPLAAATMARLSVPYKSELCRQFQRGKCNFEDNCHFAHNMSEIRGVGLRSAERFNEDSQRNAVKVCHFSSRGSDCPYGDKCSFSHRCDRNDECSYEINAVKGMSDRIDCRSLNAGEDHDRTAFYKTKLCFRWERYGSCPSGLKCTYAHGKADLQKRGHALRSMLDVQPKNATLHEVQTRIAKKPQTKGRRRYMKWDIKKISQIYGDWIEI